MMSLKESFRVPRTLSSTLGLVAVLVTVFAVEVQATDRWAIGAFTRSSISCSDAVFQTREACEIGLQEFVEGREIVGNEIVGVPECPAATCICYPYGDIGPTAACYGAAKYKDGQTCKKKKRRTIVKRFYGEGHGSREAITNAVSTMYLWVSEASKEWTVLNFRMRPKRNCNYNPYTRTAECSATLWVQQCLD